MSDFEFHQGTCQRLGDSTRQSLRKGFSIHTGATIMNQTCKIILGIVAGAAAGGAAVQGLHAQAKPVAYVVGEVDVTNRDAFVKDYVPLAMKALRESGSGYKALAVGGRTAAIEGEPPKRIVISSFDSLDQAVAAYNSAAYREAGKIGNKFGTFRVYAVEGLSQ
jgi:uncharacterized protein (DUF1330 family)